MKMSPMCREYSAHGHTFSIEIYQGDAGRWLLEVVDPVNTSHVWNEQFDSDEAALMEAIAEIDRGEIEGFGSDDAEIIDLSAAIRRALREGGAA